MSVHMRLADVGSPLSDASSYVLGMPHLNPNGLSENWLWKELGHRHWNLIAKAYGRAATGFGSVGDQPIYADAAAPTTRPLRLLSRAVVKGSPPRATMAGWAPLRRASSRSRL